MVDWLKVAERIFTSSESAPRLLVVKFTLKAGAVAFLAP